MDSFFTGGAEFSTLELFHFLEKKHVEIKICKIKRMNPEYNPTDFGLDSGLITTLPVGNFWKKRKVLQQLISEFRPDIIHSVLFKSNLLVRSIRVFDSSFVHLESLVNHTYSEDRLKETGVTELKMEGYRLLDKYTSLLGTDHFHPNGFSVANHYQQKLGINEKRMTVVHRGREGSKYDVAPANKADFGLAADKLVLINVARQEYQKGQDVLLKAVSLLPNEIVNQIHLLIVGREGKMTPSLQQQVLEAGLQNTVSFLGHRNDIPALLKMADIFVFPSRFEGLPGVLIEAEASGLPIICTDLPMMLEVVSVNENALVFELDNEAQLATAIEKLVSDKSVRDTFATRSHDTFKNNFEIEAVHERMLSLYKKILN